MPLPLRRCWSIPAARSSAAGMGMASCRPAVTATSRWVELLRFSLLLPNPFPFATPSVFTKQRGCPLPSLTPSAHATIAPCHPCRLLPIVTISLLGPKPAGRQWQLGGTNSTISDGHTWPVPFNCRLSWLVCTAPVVQFRCIFPPVSPGAENSVHTRGWMACGGGAGV